VEEEHNGKGAEIMSQFPDSHAGIIIIVPHAGLGQAIIGGKKRFP
jgi:hypothetical protein